MTAKQHQCLLTYLGYDPGVIDGVSGRATQAAIRAFQTDSGLAADGICGYDTEGELIRWVASGKKKAEAAPAAQADTKSDTFGDDVKHFTRLEFRCPCGRCSGFPAEPEKKLLTAADRIRSHFGAPAAVSSGLRCAAHNAAVGGVANSRHLSGKAMDFSVAGQTADALLCFALQQPEIRYAYAIDRSYVHIDID